MMLKVCLSSCLWQIKTLFVPQKSFNWYILATHFIYSPVISRAREGLSTIAKLGLTEFDSQYLYCYLATSAFGLQDSTQEWTLKYWYTYLKKPYSYSLVIYDMMSQTNWQIRSRKIYSKFNQKVFSSINYMT